MLSDERDDEDDAIIDGDNNVHHYDHQEQPKSFSGQEGVPSSRLRQQQPQEEQKKCKHPMIHLWLQNMVIWSCWIYAELVYDGELIPHHQMIVHGLFMHENAL